MDVSEATQKQTPADTGVDTAQNSISASMITSTTTNQQSYMPLDNHPKTTFHSLGRNHPLTNTTELNTTTAPSSGVTGKPVNANLQRLITGAAGISKRKLKPLLPTNGLTIVEQHFHHIAKDKNQVIMAVHGNLRLPPQAKHISEHRILDLLRLAQAQHYRLCSYVDYETQTAHLLATRAADLQPPLRFVDRIDSTTWLQTLNDEINTNFDVTSQTKPLWRIAMTAPKEWRGAGISFNDTLVSTNENSKSETDDARAKPASTMPCFDIVFTFHHCIGDGLSMWAFARSFFELATADVLNQNTLDLKNVLVNSDPPPLLDNLIKANTLEIIPPAAGLIRQHLRKDIKNKFKKFHLSDEIDLGTPSLPSSPTTPYTTEPMYATGVKTPNTLAPTIEIIPPSTENSYVVLESTAFSESQSQLIHAPCYSTVLSTTPRTILRLTMFSAEFSKDLRAAVKKNKTTVASAMIVAALASTRAVYAKQSKYLGLPLPTHQGWVVTTSMRHLIPGSQLLNGVDKKADPSTRVFGGYGGSISDPSMRLTPKDDLWDRSRRVKKRIGSGLFTSMRRMKLTNWCFRHPKVWNFLSKKADLAKLTRTMSVEMANLGAWDYDCAPPDAKQEDERFRLNRFGGTLNSSFEGSRALFSLGVITIGNDMSVTVGCDQAAVSDAESECFVNHFNTCLDVMRKSTGKLTLADLEKQMSK
ncbi:hypothetical protein O5D80_007330 [Batrachochytrium dendrobatidis]|nr:hypothetical protein O5D80_007330 [Batrachochytrium dendrobatidis]